MFGNRSKVQQAVLDLNVVRRALKEQAKDLLCEPTTSVWSNDQGVVIKVSVSEGEALYASNVLTSALKFAPLKAHTPIQIREYSVNAMW